MFLRPFQSLNYVDEVEKKYEIIAKKTLKENIKNKPHFSFIFDTWFQKALLSHHQPLEIVNAVIFLAERNPNCLTYQIKQEIVRCKNPDAIVYATAMLYGYDFGMLNKENLIQLLKSDNPEQKARELILQTKKIDCEKKFEDLATDFSPSANTI